MKNSRRFKKAIPSRDQSNYYNFALSEISAIFSHLRNLFGADLLNWPPYATNFSSFLRAREHEIIAKRRAENPEPAPVIVHRRVKKSQMKPAKVWLPSPEDVESHKTPAGSWTALQLAEWGVPWPPPGGWRRDLEKRYKASQGCAPSDIRRIPGSFGVASAVRRVDPITGEIIEALE